MAQGKEIEKEPTVRKILILAHQINSSLMKADLSTLARPVSG